MDIKLTDEEVWLRAYCAAMSSNNDCIGNWTDVAGKCLKEFRKKFRSEFPTHTTIELGTTINITDGPYKGVWEATQGGWRKV